MGGEKSTVDGRVNSQCELYFPGDAIVIFPDGRIEEIKPLPRCKGKLTLMQLQTAVGGYIEEVLCADNAYLMFVNEEGLVRGLPRNVHVDRYLLRDQFYDICGPAVVVKRKMVE